MNQPETFPGVPPCDLARIHRFLASDNYNLDDSDLISHLDECESCRVHLEQQAIGEELLHTAAKLLKPDEFDSAGTDACSAATMHGLTALGEQAGQHPAAVQDALDALAPSDHPEHFGRLGPYEVTGVVGVGAMGVVLKAIDPSLDRVVVLKMMAPRLANNEVARIRFLREAKAAAAILHPNVIPIHGVSSDSEIPYLVMSYIRGGSLQRRLQNNGPMPLLEVLRIGSQIAAGLEAAHAKGLVHRDIKPENVLLEDGVERVTITDFGLARAVDDNTVTQQGTIAGTPMYMSPEQARGQQVDQQTDLFSLGSVLYALCTGQPPFRADTSYGVMRRIIDESPTPIQELAPEIPDWFASIVSRLMAREKSNRFQSATDVHRLLEACLGHVQQPDLIALPEIPGTQADGTPTDPLATRSVGRRIVLAAIIAGVFVSAFAGLSTMLNRPRKPFMVGGGASVASDDWRFTSGSLYLSAGEPGVLFGMFQDPAGNRGLSYVMLFHHDYVEQTAVGHSGKDGMTFDGEVADMHTSFAIAGRSIAMHLTMQINENGNAIDTTTLTVNGRELDYKAGELLLVDLTTDSVAFTQVNAKLPGNLPDPQDIIEDTDAVARLARQLAELDGVRKFLTLSPSKTDIPR